MALSTRLVGPWLTMAAVLLFTSGCEPCDVACPIPDTEPPGIVSNPVASVAEAAGGSAALAAASDEFVYVSLPPDSFPPGEAALIRHLRSGSTIATSMVNGGLDPVPVAASAGDELELEIRRGTGEPLAHLTLAVPETRKPRVVRVYPAHKKRDVVLNARPVIFFTEPIAGGTVTQSSVQLFRGATAVAGTVKLLDGTGAIAAFVPAAALAANTEYRLEVTQAVKDLDGDALARREIVEFTTGVASSGPPASIRMSPDSTLNIAVGATYQLTAIVLDAGGNVLIDQPVTWSTSDASGLTVSPTGLLTTLGDGVYRVTASVANGVSRGLSVFVGAAPAASVAVTPTPATVAVGDTILLAATVRDAAGRIIRAPSVTWTSGAPAVATVASFNAGLFGIVTGMSAGSVTITATSGSMSGTAAVTVAPPRPVASVTIIPSSAVLIVQGRAQLAATLQDANGRTISSRPITWTSDNTAAATVDTTGLVTGVGQGSAAVIVTSESVSDTAAITVTTITFGSVSAGYTHTCGVTTDGVAYCWGANFYRQLGNDLPPQLLYPHRPGLDDEYYDGSFVPVAVKGGLTFSGVRAGGVHTCGLAANGAAHCWGVNYLGQLGIGGGLDGFTGNDPALEVCNWEIYGPSCSSSPMAVTGGLTFSALAAGEGDAYTPDYGHTCGLTTGGAAYCWGSNSHGQLGNGSTGFITSSSVPVAVTGGLTFTSLSLGSTHTCGLTADGSAYCWADNRSGKLGNGAGADFSSPTPVAVTGGLSFAALSVGAWHACGLTTGGAVYCWGSNYYGQLGNGSTGTSAVPVAVSGGLTFAALSAGGFHTCGLTAAGTAYCWGIDRTGQLGIGSTALNQCATETQFPWPCSPTPLAVAGGLSFATLSAGGVHTCGLTTSGVAYCWGDGGPIGDGSLGSRVPVKVAGQP